MKRLVALALVLIIGVSCASDDGADQAARGRGGKGRSADGAKGDGGKGKGAESKKGGSNVQEGIEEAGGAGVTAEEAPEDFGGENAPTSGIDPSLARVGAAIDDSSTDAKKQGIAPDYTEATRASIQGLGQSVRFTMRFGGNVPQTVRKDQYMVIAFGVTGDKENEGIAIGATCDEKGWHPYAGTKGEPAKFPGTFEIQGTEVVLEIPWSFVKGPRAFEWYASTGWYSQIANQTHWAFDSVPNGRAAKFPG